MADKPTKGDITGQYISNLNSPYITTTSWNQNNPFYANGAKDTNFGWFGPLEPLYPIAPPEVAGRQFDYQAGYNLNTVTRPYSAVPFWQLRALADGYDILRIIIETRKNEIGRKLWAIKPREEDGNKEDPDIKQIEQFFRRPDGIHDFRSWLKMLVEDLFVIDALAVYVHRNKAGKMINLFPIAGDTIKPVIDDWGRRPGPIMDAGKIVYPVAYQQILHGYPAIDYSMRDLIYRPMNVRTNHVYGYSIVEQIIGTIQVGLRRQSFLLDYYEDGTIPDCLIGTPDTWCYSDDTEVLTKRGWLRFGEVDHVNDEFATRNKDGKFEWQHATGINRTIYKGKMVAIKSKTIDCLVNPPHRVLISTKGKFDPNYEKIKTAGDLLEDHKRDERIPVVSLWENGVEIETQIFAHNQTQGQCRDIAMTGDQFCMFMGAYLSEGHLNQRSVFITQPENGNGYNQYYNLLKDILGEPAAYDKKQAFSFGSTPLVDYLRQFGKAVNKFIPEQIMNATKAQIELFLEYYLLGDGSFDKKTISTSSKKMADQLQELVQKIGKSATISEDDRRGRTIYIGDDRTATTNSINYIVHISESQCRRFDVTEELDYNDFVSCVSVPNGILYVRRNGKPCWSGNTPDQISAYQRHWDSYFDSNLARKRKAKFVPGGVAKTFIQTKEPELKGELDEWIARVCCKAFAISPTGFVRDTNRATAEVASSDSEAQGLQPVLDYIVDFMDYIIEVEFGRPDLTFAWQEDNEVSATEQQTILSGYVTTGQLTINESRAIRGLPPLPDPEANQALIMTANGYVPLNQQAAVQQKVNEQKALQPLQPKPAAPGPQNVKKAFDPDEPRDEHGRWTDDGGGQGTHTELTPKQQREREVEQRRKEREERRAAKEQAAEEYRKQRRQYYDEKARKKDEELAQARAERKAKREAREKDLADKRSGYNYNQANRDVKAQLRRENESDEVKHATLIAGLKQLGVGATMITVGHLTAIWNYTRDPPNEFVDKMTTTAIEKGYDLLAHGLGNLGQHVADLLALPSKEYKELVYEIKENVKDTMYQYESNVILQNELDKKPIDTTETKKPRNNWTTDQVKRDTGLDGEEAIAERNRRNGKASKLAKIASISEDDKTTMLDLFDNTFENYITLLEDSNHFSKDQIHQIQDGLDEILNTVEDTIDNFKAPAEKFDTTNKFFKVHDVSQENRDKDGKWTTGQYVNAAVAAYGAAVVGFAAMSTYNKLKAYKKALKDSLNGFGEPQTAAWAQEMGYHESHVGINQPSIVEDDKPIVNRYTCEHGLFQRINTALRNNKSLSKQDASFVKKLDAVVQKGTTLDTTKTFFKGVAGEMFAKLKEGDILIDKAFNSLTTSKTFAEMVALNRKMLLKETKDFVFHLTPSPGTIGLYVTKELSNMYHQCEVILPRGSAIKIIEVSGNIIKGIITHV